MQQHNAILLPPDTTLQPWYQNPAARALFLHILLSADTAGRLVTTLARLAEQTALSVQQVRSALRALTSKQQTINKRTTNQCTTITILNYERYNASQQADNKRATSNQQTNNKPKTKISPPATAFSKPTIEQVQAYIDQKGYHFSAAEFVAYYESKGWLVGRSPMKNWHAACITWEKNALPQTLNQAYRIGTIPQTPPDFHNITSDNFFSKS